MAFYALEHQVLSQPGQIFIPVLLPNELPDGQVMQLLPFEGNNPVEVLEDRLKRIQALEGSSSIELENCDDSQTPEVAESLKET